jgi:hypothetical protein
VNGSMTNAVGLPVATADDILRELLAAHVESNEARRSRAGVDAAAARMRRAWKAAERHAAGTPVLAGGVMVLQEGQQYVRLSPASGDYQPVKERWAATHVVVPIDGVPPSHEPQQEQPR